MSIVVCGNQRHPVASVHAPQRRVVTAPTPLIRHEPPQQSERFLTTLAKGLQSLGRVISEVLSLNRPAIRPAYGFIFGSGHFMVHFSRSEIQSRCELSSGGLPAAAAGWGSPAFSGQPHRERQHASRTQAPAVAVHKVFEHQAMAPILSLKHRFAWELLRVADA